MQRKYSFLLIMVATLLLTTWLMNTPIRHYMQQQHYASNYPYLAFFEAFIIPENALFEFGNRLKKILSFAPIAPQPLQEIAQLPQETEQIKPTPATPTQDIEILNDTNTTEPLPATLPPINEPPTLQKGDVVVLIGDSLMQGVGITLVSRLKKQGAIPINLSKQSTGLTYNHYFDWEKALGEALNAYDVKYVVVMLGANDPWDMIDPNNKARYIRFKTTRWEEIYRTRIQNLLVLAKTHGAQVFWYEAPYMKKPKLNSGILYLNTLYADEVRKNHGVFLPSNEVLSDDENFSAYITRDNEKIKVRANDGIHFSPKGSQVLSELLMQHLVVPPKQPKE